jgi:hypothetical protein
MKLGRAPTTERILSVIMNPYKWWIADRRQTTARPEFLTAEALRTQSRIFTTKYMKFTKKTIFTAEALSSQSWKSHHECHEAHEVVKKNLAFNAKTRS